MYPAKNGDCFLILIGNETKKHILLDLGYGETFDKFLFEKEGIEDTEISSNPGSTLGALLLKGNTTGIPGKKVYQELPKDLQSVVGKF